VSLNCSDHRLTDYPPGTCPPYSRRQRPGSFNTGYSSHCHNTHVALCYGDATLSLYVTFFRTTTTATTTTTTTRLTVNHSSPPFFLYFPLPIPPSKKAITVIGGRFLGR